jgi:hypothetical protein
LWEGDFGAEIKNAKFEQLGLKIAILLAKIFVS